MSEDWHGDYVLAEQGDNMHFLLQKAQKLSKEENNLIWGSKQGFRRYGAGSIN